jgi:hypothetical protein
MADFAPLYTTRERLWLALKMLAVAIPVYVAGYYGLFPWLRRYAETANCDRFAAFSGLELLLYGLLVGSPLSMAGLIWLIEGRHSLRVWRLGQSPLPGEKVLRRTRYRFGVRARIRPLVVFSMIALLAGIALRGGFLAAELVREIGPCGHPGVGRSSLQDCAESRAHRVPSW